MSEPSRPWPRYVREFGTCARLYTAITRSAATYAGRDAGSAQSSKSTATLSGQLYRPKLRNDGGRRKQEVGLSAQRMFIPGICPCGRFESSFGGPSLRDCQQIDGKLRRHYVTDRGWHAKYKAKLIAAWNKTRPSD